MYTNRMAVARRYGKSHRASRLFGEAEGFNIPYDAERIHISTELAEADGISLAEVLEKFNIALKAKLWSDLGFDINIMGCEFYRMGKSQMSSMPILDTCTEVTASLLKLPGGRGGKNAYVNGTALFSINLSVKRTMRLPMSRQLRVFLELIREILQRTRCSS
jgi:DNA polymerase-3 subunit alpha